MASLVATAIICYNKYLKLFAERLINMMMMMMMINSISELCYLLTVMLSVAPLRRRHSAGLKHQKHNDTLTTCPSYGQNRIYYVRLVCLLVFYFLCMRGKGTWSE